MQRGIAVAGVLGLLIGTPAGAEKPDPAGQGGKSPEQAPAAASGRSGSGARGLAVERKRAPDLVEPMVRFSIRERDLARGWYVQEYGRGKCPRGLAKKDKQDKRCLPPGLAKKRYTIGQPLGVGIVLAPLPIDLARRLGPPPVGYRYGIIDGELVKLALGTLLLVDAVDGLVD